MKLMNEFKAFAIKGNIIDMAVGIIIGLAFGKIVSSAVADLVMPPLGLLIGGVNFTDLKVILKPATETAAAVTLNYGNFLQAVFDFLIIAFSVFLIIKGILSFKKKEETLPSPPAVASNEELLLAEIRDLLKNRKQGI